jgi:hypothetical protein
MKSAVPSLYGYYFRIRHDIMALQGVFKFRAMNMYSADYSGPHAVDQPGNDNS